jgi:uncharacterized protein YqgV (UPF0045/DUF77 family)
MVDLRSDYDSEQGSKRMRDPYGETAEVPRTPIGVTAGMLKGQPIAARIADLSKQVAEAAHMLSEARTQYERAALTKSKLEMEFSRVAEAMTQAINEHREGTPETVPYQP